MAFHNSSFQREHYLKFLVLILAIFGVFFVLQVFGPAITSFLIGPVGTAPYFQNATRPSGPDIVITNITLPTSLKAGAVNSINVNVNVTNGNGSRGLGNWTVNVTLFQTVPAGPFAQTWRSYNTSGLGQEIDGIVIRNLDRDGFADIIYLVNDSGASGGNVSVSYGTGSTNTGLWENYSTAGGGTVAMSLAVGDMDENGRGDLVVGYTDRISVINSTGARNIAGWGSFNTTTAGTVYSVAVADLDSDGDIDIVAGLGDAGDRISIYNNTGWNGINIANWAVYNASTADDARVVAVADFDSDGDSDVVAAIRNQGASGNRISLYNNPGNNLNISQWAVTHSTTGTKLSTVLAVGDLDNDGDYDVIAGFNNTSAQLSVYNNTGGSGMNIAEWPTINVTPLDAVTSLAIDDLNNDGLNDFVVGFGGTTDQFAVYNNSGTINISTWPSVSVPTAENVNALALWDIDLDGDSDIAAGVGFGGTNSRLSVYNNSDVTSTYLDSQVQLLQNVSNILVSYTFNWTPAITATGNINFTAVADISANYTEVIRSNNRIVATSSIGCLSPEGVPVFWVNNTTTLCTATYLMNVSDGNAAIRVQNSSLTLDCNGATIVNNNRANNGIGLFVNNSSVTIKGCTFANYTFGALVNLTFNVNFTNNTFLNNTHGIFLNSTNQTTIWNQTLRFNDLNGLWNFRSNNTTITNSTIYNNSEHGIRLLAGINNTIQNNTVFNNVVTGISVEDTNNTTLFNNTVSHTSGSHAGIMTNISSSNLTIKRNIVEANRIDGILILGNDSQCGWNLIENNTVSNNSAGQGYGITMFRCPNSTIMNNSIYNNTAGMYISQSNFSVRIKDNLIYNNIETGIRVQDESNLTILNNTIFNNSNHGIWVLMGRDILIQNNTIYNNTRTGILFELVNNTSILNNSISYGTNVTDGIGIYINTSGNITIKSNRISHNYLSGIIINLNIIGALCGWNLVENNTLFNNTGTGLSSISCGNFTLKNNTIHNSTRGVSLKLNNKSLISDNLIFNNTLGININGDWNITIINNTIINNNVSTLESNNRTGIRIFQEQWINSSSINITGNRITGQDFGIDINESPFAYNVTVYDNYFNNSQFNARDRSGGNNTWNISKRAGRNIINGPFVGGNFWSDYGGADRDGDLLGDTLIPYNASENISVAGDYAPLILQTALLHSLILDVNHTLFWNNNRGVLNVSNATFANFTLQAPNGTKLINDTNGSWSGCTGTTFCNVTSALKRFDVNGTWWLNVSAGNVTSSSINQTDSIRIDIWDNVSLNTTAVSFTAGEAVNSTVNRTINSSTNETLNYTATFVFNNVTTHAYFNYSCTQINGTTSYIIGNGTWTCAITAKTPSPNQSEYDVHHWNISINRTAFAVGTYWTNISGNYTVTAPERAPTAISESAKEEKVLEEEVKAPPPKMAQLPTYEDTQSYSSLAVGSTIDIYFGEAEKSYQVQKDTYYTLRVSVQGTNIYAFVNDNKVFELHDAAYKSGSVGLKTIGTVSTFDGVRVTDIRGAKGETYSDFVDNFADAKAENWKPANGIWDASGRVYTQRSRVADEQVTLVGDKNWADYELETKVSIDPTSQKAVTGIVFRAQDSENYYQFLLDNNKIGVRKEVAGITFGVGETEKHNISIKKITKDRVTLLIFSNPIVVDVIPGQKAFVDVNGDGQNDLAILVSKVSGEASVDMVVEKLRVEKQAPTAALLAKPEGAPEERPGEAPKVSGEIIQPLPPGKEVPKFPTSIVAAVLSAAVVVAIGASAYISHRKRARIADLRMQLQGIQKLKQRKAGIPPPRVEKPKEQPHIQKPQKEEKKEEYYEEEE